jgi:hypothetical protein
MLQLENLGVCLFVQHCIKEADKVYEIIFKENKLPSKIFKSEHCMTVLTKSPRELISPVPKIGSIVIWNYVGSARGAYWYSY